VDPEPEVATAASSTAKADVDTMEARTRLDKSLLMDITPPVKKVISISLPKNCDRKNAFLQFFQ
jgi:hypothetical protein